LDGLLSTLAFGFALSVVGVASAEVEAPAEPDSVRAVLVRVLTWNVWGVPRISPHLAARMRALPDAIVSQSPDLIVLQELWQREHAVSVGRALEQRGYAYWQHLAGSPRGETGLFVASKWPLTPLAFQRFRAGRLPHSFWHLDWMVSKGVGSFWLETPLGRVLIENTHLQAQYVTDSYEGERLSQASELVLLHRERPGAPLILAGDFNSGARESPRRALTELGGLLDANPAGNEDTLYVRDGSGIALRVVGVRAVLGEPRALDDGGRMPLSDHHAVRVELELSRCPSCTGAAPSGAAVRSDAVAILARASDTTRGRVAASLLASLGLLAIAVVWRRKLTHAPLRAGPVFRLRGMAVALLAIGFVWSFYLGTIYYPARGRALSLILRELAKHVGVQLP
jgi:endonuclease/exonuclease/phosphatase family metal-dependent hydrolase